MVQTPLVLDLELRLLHQDYATERRRIMTAQLFDNVQIQLFTQFLTVLNTVPRESTKFPQVILF